MRKVFITGASGDIGLAIKNKFLDSNNEVVAPTHEELDLQRTDSINNYFKSSSKDFDVIVYCAGFNAPKTIEELLIDDIEKTYKINALAFFEIAKILSPYMKHNKQGHILAISSLYGTISRTGRLAYTASKHSLNGMMKTLACELGKYNILVNTLSPGFVDTKMTRKNNSFEQIENLRKKIPLKRLATTNDIAETAYYLCSEKNSYITGQDIIVDGGFLAEGGQN